MEVGKVKTVAAKPKRAWWLSPYVIGVMAFIAGFALIGILWWLAPKGQQINRDAYQAVYLANGQMYFGKLENTEGTYLYVSAPYMPQTTSAQPESASQAIVKVKSQLWGPEDSIAIRADQVAFWQNLRDDSKVTQAIKSKENE